MDEKKKKQLGVIIPVVLAVIVVCGFAVSGHITKNFDKEMPTAETTTAETTEETTLASSKVTMVAVGDNLIHNTLVAAGEKEDGTLDYNSFYENIKSDIAAADIAVINQETMLGGSAFPYAGYPCFNTPWEVGDAAIAAGFDIFTCATNHTMDVGFAGIEQECKYFSQHPEVLHIGTYTSEADHNQIAYYESNGIKFALLNYTYGTNGISLPEGKEWCTNMMDKEKITADVTEARQNADVVIVFPHWGTENSTSVSDYQRDYVQLFMQLGVDIVIGTHPHVLQTVEWVTDEASGRKMLVYYSLGNFISHQTSLNQLCGGMAQITIEKNNGEISITNAKLMPVCCWYSSSNGKYKFSVYRISDYTEELGNSHKQSGATPSYFKSYAEDIIPEEFLNLG